jgi:CRISPR-associated protein Csb1
MNTTTLDPTAILADTTRHRLILEATLKPVIGDLFQPAGFPEIGHVIYKAPRPGNASQEVCIVDSAASMANHLETVMHSNPLTHILHPDLAGLPYIECTTDEGWPKVT